MADILEFSGPTRLSIPVDRVLDRAKDAGLSEVVVIGYDKDGAFYFAGSEADGPNNLWLLALAQKKLLEIGDPD